MQLITRCIQSWLAPKDRDQPRLLKGIHMSDLKLFRIDDLGVHELKSSTSPLEKQLQEMIERHMDVFFGVRFLATEYSTGKKHGGRIDSLGVDENGSPVIFEYKRTQNENVINQGLFYLDWMLDHRAEFEKLAEKQFGSSPNDWVDWSSPRLVCVANDFNRYDEHAISQIDRSIDLVRYRLHEENLVSLELVASTSASATSAGESIIPKASGAGSQGKTVSQFHDQASSELKSLYATLEAVILAQGDDVTKTVRKNYFAFRRIRNFACVEIHPQARKIVVFVKGDLESVSPDLKAVRDVSSIGHFGTGNLEVTLTSTKELNLAEHLIQQSYLLN